MNVKQFEELLKQKTDIDKRIIKYNKLTREQELHQKKISNLNRYPNFKITLHCSGWGYEGEVRNIDYKESAEIAAILKAYWEGKILNLELEKEKI